ncbi:hypothetical protein ABZ835_11165 [Streptomyces sp. NPDC047461]|uniref:hypothetical protein n=1 Tax=Streptomyces sp. NPDC047461 TaxID=3155619 RepID=UPI0033EF4521
MVVRSISQGLQEWVRTFVLGTATAGLSDEELKAQAIQDPQQTQNLIDIENARGAVKAKIVTRIGVLALIGIAMMVGALLVIVQAAGELHLPWHRIGTVVVTVLGASGIAGFVKWWVTRLIKRRRSASAPTPEPASQNPAGGDPNQVGTAPQ